MCDFTDRDTDTSTRYLSRIDWEISVRVRVYYTDLKEKCVSENKRMTIYD